MTEHERSDIAALLDEIAQLRAERAHVVALLQAMKNSYQRRSTQADDPCYKVTYERVVFILETILRETGEGHPDNGAVHERARVIAILRAIQATYKPGATGAGENAFRYGFEMAVLAIEQALEEIGGE